jgi:hypothetical protein
MINLQQVGLELLVYQDIEAKEFEAGPVAGMGGGASLVGVSKLRLHTQQGLNDHVLNRGLQLPDVMPGLLQILIDVFQCPLELRLILGGKLLTILVNSIVSQVNEQILAPARRGRDVFLCGKAT